MGHEGDDKEELAEGESFADEVTGDGRIDFREAIEEFTELFAVKVFDEDFSNIFVIDEIFKLRSERVIGVSDLLNDCLDGWA